MTARRFTEAEVLADFADALAAAGFLLRSPPMMDGAWHRAAIEGDKGRETSGRYRGYIDGIRPAGFIENFRDATRTGAWKYGGPLVALAPAEVEAQRRIRAEIEARRARERAALALVIAAEAERRWKAAPPALACHPYLARKGIHPHGSRLSGSGRLLVPMRGLADGRLAGLQEIAPDGAKLFAKGAGVIGTHLLLGALAPGALLLVAEGFATGATLQEATGLAVAVAFAKSNFSAIARAYAACFPGLRIVFAGDNDHRLARNVGREAAEDAARETGGVAILPDFESEDSGSDWNDYAAQHGRDAVRQAIEAALAVAFPPQLQPHYPAPTATRDEALGALDRQVAGLFDDAAAHIVIRRAWAAKLADIDLLTPPKAPGRRAALRQARTEMAAAHGPDWRKPGRRLLVPGAAGSGKTALAARQVATAGAALGHVAYRIDKTSAAQDFAELVLGAAVLRGRGQPDPLIPDRSMCWRPAAARAVAEAGLPVGSTLCRDAAGRVCPFIDSCGYQREARRFRSGEVPVIAGAHDYLVHHAPTLPPDIVVIDENPLGPLIGRLEFGLDRLLPDAMPEWQAAGLPQAMAFRECMAKVRDAISDPAGILAGLRQRGITAAGDFKPPIAYLRAAEQAAFTGDIAPDTPDAEIVDRLDRHRRSEVEGVLKLLAALQAEIGMPRDIAHGVAFHPDKPVKIDGRRERQARVSVHYRKRLAIPADVTLLILDADGGDGEIYRRLFGERLEVAAGVRCERNAYVVQVIDTPAPKSSLLGTDRRGNPLSSTSVAKAARLRADVAAMANSLAAKHGGAFMLATTMPVETALQPDLAEGILTGHFGALKGSNAYQDCAAGMVLSREQTWPHAVEDIARALWSDDPEPLNLTGKYIQATRGIRMRDGSAHPVKVTVHPDHRVQRVLEMIRERGSEQAADRLRPIHNLERKTLYLACNLPLDMTVDRVVTFNQLLHEATGRMDNGRTSQGRRIYGDRLAEAYRRCGGVLPLSRTVLMDLFGPEGRLLPGLYGSERALRDDLAGLEIKLADSAIGVSFAESAYLNPALARYRLEGQRGRNCRALVGPAGDAGRAALEALVGPLAAYEVEAPADPEPPPTHPPRPPPEAQEAPAPAAAPIPHPAPPRPATPRDALAVGLLAGFEGHRLPGAPPARPRGGEGRRAEAATPGTASPPTDRFFPAPTRTRARAEGRLETRE